MVVLGEEVLVVVDVVDVSKFIGLLYGVFFIIKENIDIVGIVILNGLLVFVEVIFVIDVLVVVCMKGVGVILIGCMNLLEMGLWLFIDNLLCGCIFNFWNKELIVGGLSGGEGVVLVMGMMLIGFGNDIGGLFCNLVYCNGIMFLKLI